MCVPVKCKQAQQEPSQVQVPGFMKNISGPDATAPAWTLGGTWHGVYLLPKRQGGQASSVYHTYLNVWQNGPPYHTIPHLLYSDNWL